VILRYRNVNCLFEVDKTPPNLTHHHALSFWVLVGPGDDGQPVITIGFPEDFSEGNHDWERNSRSSYPLREHLLPGVHPQSRNPAEAGTQNDL